jgi:hypothetical protein
LVVYADKARPDTSKVTRAIYDHNFSELQHIRIPDFAGLSFLSFFLFSCFNISKTAFKDGGSGLQMTFFRKSEKFWTKSALML